MHEQQSKYHKETKIRYNKETEKRKSLPRFCREICFHIIRLSAHKSYDSHSHLNLKFRHSVQISMLIRKIFCAFEFKEHDKNNKKSHKLIFKLYFFI